jgi:hypothetical protein
MLIHTVIAITACRLVALRVISPLYSNLVAFRTKRTSDRRQRRLAGSQMTRSGIRLGAVAIATIKSVPLGKV